jgi:hypothetical protein
MPKTETGYTMTFFDLLLSFRYSFLVGEWVRSCLTPLSICFGSLYLSLLPIFFASLNNRIIKRKLR